MYPPASGGDILGVIQIFLEGEGDISNFWRGVRLKHFISMYPHLEIIILSQLGPNNIWIM